MPTVLDATVVNSAYDTSGNGGRKLVRLDNGWLVSAVKQPDYVYLYVDKRDGNGFAPLCHVYEMNNDISDCAIVFKGNTVYLMSGRISAYYLSWKIDVPNQSNVNIYSSFTQIEINPQSAIGNCSLTINEAKTELHATWSSKNSTYSSSFNIRYAKGTINADGSVTWGAVEQVTTFNATADYFQNPSISIVNNQPNISVEVKNGTSYFIAHLSKSHSNRPTLTAVVSSAWGTAIIHNGITYTQSSPSAIFVPQSVNGLANGRIWVTWSGRGTDGATTLTDNVRASYSDDGGVTWSVMEKLSNELGGSGNANPSITANKQNRICILYHGADSVLTTQFRNIKKLVWESNVWNIPVTITNNTTHEAVSPSSLYDLNISFSEPLFIYRNIATAKVGFYGTWTVTTISVTQGSIGQKTSPSPLLTYAITTDGTMSTITEKVNGVTIGTKTATSGQSLIAGLTQEQWDAVKFGKYKDATGGLNTLTVEMGSEVFTYTFDKRLATDADVLSAVKAVQDADSVYLPSVKKKLVDKFGGSAGDSFETIINGIPVIKKQASGIATSSSSSLSFLSRSGTTDGRYYISISGLDFLATTIEITLADGTDTQLYTYTAGLGHPITFTLSRNSASPYGISLYPITGNATVNSTGFLIPVGNQSTSYKWKAKE